MTATEIRAEFWKLSPLAQVLCYDTTYDLPTVDWIQNKFYPWFKKTRWNGDLSNWSRKNDCDNFARAFCVFCQDAHVLSSGTADALAVGEFAYIANADVKGPHAIVAAFTDEGLVFFEPQNGQRLALTPLEIQTCFLVRF